MQYQKNIQVIEESLENLPTALSGSQYYIGNDTGIKHLCVALKIPTLTLFGPEPPLEWHPYNPDDHPYLYKEPLACRTVKTHYCGLSSCESMVCLNEFTPIEVLKRFQQRPIR